MATKRTILELQTVGGDKVKVDLSKIGEQGQRSMQRILDSTKPASAGMKAFDSASRTAQVGVQGLASRLGPLGSVLSSIGPAGLAAAGLAGGGIGLFALTKSAINTADAIGKASDRIGIHVEVLQELRFAATQSGLSTEGLDKALESFTKRVGEAQAGTGQLVTLLKKQDVALLENVRSAGSTEEAMDLAFKAIENAGSATEKAALANAFFGREGLKMVNVLEDGTAGLQAMRERARELGLVLSEETIRKAEKAGDQLEVLSDVIKLNLTDALLSLAPVLGSTAEGLAEAAAAAAGFWRSLQDEAPSSTFEFIGTLRAKLAELREQLEKPAIFRVGGLSTEAVKEQIADLERQIELQQQLLAKQQASGKEREKEQADQRKTLEQIAEEEKARKAAAAESVRARSTALADIAKLEDAAAKATLDRIAFVDHEEAKAIAEQEKRLQQGLINREEFERAATLIQATAVADRLKITEEEEKKKEKAREAAEKITTETERKITLATLKESDQRKLEFVHETEDRLKQLRVQLEAQGKNEAEITAILDRERGNREKLYGLEVEAAKKAGQAIKLEISSIVGELTTGILRGTRDWEDGWDLLKDAGVGALGKILEEKLKKFDPEFDINFTETLPEMLVGFADEGQFIFEKFFQNVLNLAGGFGSKLLEAMGFGGGGLDFSFGGSGGGGIDAGTVAGAAAGGAGGVGGGFLGNKLGGPVGGIIGAVLGKIIAEQLASAGATALAGGGATAITQSGLGNAAIAALADKGVLHLAADKAGNLVIQLGPGPKGISLFGGGSGGISVGGFSGSEILGGIGGGITGALRGPHLGANKASKGEQLEIGLLLAMAATGNIIPAIAYGGVRAGMTATDAILGRKSFADASATERSAAVFSPFGDRTAIGVFEDLFFGANIGKLLGLGEASGFLPDLFGERLSKGQATRRGIIGDVLRPSASVGSLFPEGGDVPFRTSEIEAFPDLIAEAGNAVTAFGIAFGQAVKTPLSLTDELRNQFNILIGSFGEAGIAGEEAITRTAALMRELGFETDHVRALIDQAFEEGKVSVEQYQAALAGLDDVAKVSVDEMVETLKAGLGEEALGVFHRMVAAGVDSFNAVTAASNEAFLGLAGPLENGMLPRAQSVFAHLTALGVTSAEQIARAWAGLANISLPSPGFVNAGGKLLYVDTAGNPIPAPELSGPEQVAARREAPKIPGFQLGGLVTGTGLAMLHGSPAAPERVLSPEQNRTFERLDRLAAALEHGLNVGRTPAVVVAPVMEPGNVAQYIRRAERTGHITPINPTLGVRR